MATTILIDLSQLCLPPCDGSWPPDHLEGLFLSWLRHHFSSADRILASPLKTRLWSETLASSKILIEPVTKWKPETTEQRPAILVKDDGYRPLPLGIDNRLMGASGQNVSRRIYSTIIAGSTSLICVSRQPGEAKTLAFEVFLELLGFQSVVRDRAGLARVAVLQVPSVAVVEESTQNYAVPVTLAYAFWHNWEVIDPAAQALSLTEVDASLS